MTTHGVLNVIARIRPEMMEPLRVALRVVTDDVDHNELVPFASLRTVHFGRFVIVEEAPDAHGSPIPASLMLSTAHDQPLEEHLQQLVSVAGPGLERIFRNCEDFAGSGGSTAERVLTFLREHVVPTAALFIGTWGRSVHQVHQESRLREEIQDFLDRESGQRNWAHASGLEVRQAIQGLVAGNPDLAWARTPAPPQHPRLVRHGPLIGLLTLGGLAAGYLLFLGSLKSLVLGGAAVAGTLLVLLLLFLLVLRIHEIRDVAMDPTVLPQHVSRLANAEDHPVMNPMTMVSNTRPGLFRILTQRLAMALVTVNATFIFNQGTMGGIASIHFAYWVICDREKRLLFLSNYDGSWENYLGDFIDRAAWALTAAWTSCTGFPKTRFLFFDGATDERRFKAWVRSQQVVTQVWYTAYPDLTSRNINDNSKLRAGLYGSMTESEARSWLRLLGSSPTAKEAAHAGA